MAQLAEFLLQIRKENKSHIGVAHATTPTSVGITGTLCSEHAFLVSYIRKC